MTLLYRTGTAYCYDIINYLKNILMVHGTDVGGDGHNHSRSCYGSSGYGIAYCPDGFDCSSDYVRNYS